MMYGLGCACRVQCDQVRVGAGRDPALARRRSSRAGLLVNAGNASESGSPRASRIVRVSQQRAGLADGHAADAAVRVEAGQAATGIRADRHAFGRRAAGEIPLQRIGRAS